MIPKCCCGGCIIGQDKFSANDGRPHSGWTARDAIWGTAGGDEATDSGGVYDFPKPGMQKFNTAHPDGAGANQHVKVRFKLHEVTSGQGAVAAVIVGYLDDTHYLVARVEKQGTFGTGCDYLTLYKFNAGSSSGYYSALDYGVSIVPIRNLTLDEWHTLDVCLLPNNYGTYSDGDTIRAKVTLADGTTWGCQGIAAGYSTGAYVGLANEYVNFGTGGGDNTLYGEVYFDDFEFTYFRDTSTHKSCPNCNGPCHIFDDTFNTYSAASDNVLGCFWSATQSPATGTARFDGTYLQCDASSRIKCLVPHPTNKSSKIITVTFKWEASKQVKVDTGSGYAIFDSTAGARRIRLYDNSGTLLDSSAVNSLPAYDDAIHTAEVCLEDGALTATMDSVCLDAVSTDTGDAFVYLGSTSGTVKFASFDFKKHWDINEPKDSGCDKCDCPTECPTCSGSAPGYIAVTIPDDVSCNGACGDVGGTYILPFNPFGVTYLPEGYCGWGARTYDCGTPGVDCQFSVGSVLTHVSGSYYLTVTLSGSNQIEWTLNLGTSLPDCNSFSQTEIPYDSSTSGAPACECSAGGLPAKVTSL